MFALAIALLIQIKCLADEILVQFAAAKAPAPENPVAADGCREPLLDRRTGQPKL
jgi:hypothetical protein